MRNAQRKPGERDRLRDVIVGAALAGLGALALIFFPHANRPFSRILGMVIAGGIYGVWRACRGIARLVEGARVRGSLTDM